MALTKPSCMITLLSFILRFHCMFFIFHSSQRASLAGMENEKHAMKNAKREKPLRRDLHPPLLPMAPQDRLAQHDLAVPVLERRESRRRRKVSPFDVPVERVEALLERVRVTFHVPAGIACRVPGRRRQQRRVLEQAL